MAPEPETSLARATTVPLLVSHQVALDLGRAMAAMTNVDWLGSMESSPAGLAGWRRVSTILVLPITDGSAPGPVRKGAWVDLGPATVSDDAVVLDVGWQSDSMTPLFPVFAGQLRITPDGLFLEGRYAPPFGRLGLLIDERILHFIAQRTGQAFLDRLANRIAG